MTLDDIFAFLESGQPPAEDAGLFGATIPEELAGIHVIGVPWDVTVSYGDGTHKAPEAIRQASHQLDLIDRTFGQTFRRGIALQSLDELLILNATTRTIAERVIAAIEQGESPCDEDLQQVNDACHTMNQTVAETARTSLATGKKVCLLGGDHSTPFGLVQALSEVHESFGILHIDAHHDLRKAYEGFTYSHASILYNVLHSFPQVKKVVSVGIRDFSATEMEMATQDNRMTTWYDEDIFAQKANGVTWSNLVTQMLDSLPDKIYLTLDIDGLSREFCPNTGTPVPGGLHYQEVVFLLNQLGQSNKQVIGFDLVEVGPSQDEWDANVGARLLYKCCGVL